MAADKKLFGNFKECEYCGRPLPLHYEKALCPHCLEANLFREVKEYIRSNIVNEYEVAQHFNIPLKQVKAWIRDGRIEYRENDVPHLSSVHCQQCGAPISFGSLCSKCMKAANSGKGFSIQTPPTDADSRMRYLDNTDK